MFPLFNSIGDMTEDSRSWYYYDLADRLIRVVSKETSNTVLECSYDGLGRRREVTRDGTNIERYVYLPGTFLVLAVLDDNDAVKEIYTYGPDLSGTLSGAGGVGGILGGVDFIESVTNAMHSDALGNIVMLTDGDGAVAAVYQYGPFGKITGQTGTRSSRFMFSSKEYDPETGLCYYGYRFYDTQRGQWINRDPIGERGGINLYGFVGNAPLLMIDKLGLVYGTGNPVSDGNGLVGPSIPYMPNPYYIDSLPWGPSIFDHLPVGISGEIDQSAWFLQRLPHMVYKEINDATAYINVMIAKNCDKKGSKAEIDYVTYVIPNNCAPLINVFNPFRDTSGTYESMSGDRPQSLWEARAELGRFEFIVQSPVDVVYMQNGEECGNGKCLVQFWWKTDLYVQDWAGPHGFEKSLIRARWSLEGHGYCCEK